MESGRQVEARDAILGSDKANPSPVIKQPRSDAQGRPTRASKATKPEKEDGEVHRLEFFGSLTADAAGDATAGSV